VKAVKLLKLLLTPFAGLILLVYVCLGGDR